MFVGSRPTEATRWGYADGDGDEQIEEWACVPGCPVRILDKQSGLLKSGSDCTRTKVGRFLEHGGLGRSGDVQVTHGGSGGASRFFYCAKASRRERGEGNNHPTVKSLALMRWLCRLITPPNGIVLDPFAGSGTTLCAALHEGFRGLGFDSCPEYVEIANRRIAVERERLGEVGTKAGSRARVLEEEEDVRR